MFTLLNCPNYLWMIIPSKYFKEVCHVVELYFCYIIKLFHYRLTILKLNTINEQLRIIY